jgi:1-deoxy-D-xylulose-5-phosphate synthase
LECLNANEIELPVIRVGWPDAFIEHGRVDRLREKYGLTAEAAMERARPYLRKAVAV